MILPALEAERGLRAGRARLEAELLRLEAELLRLEAMRFCSWAFFPNGLRPSDLARERSCETDGMLSVLGS